jgi:hypothetical protein
MWGGPQMQRIRGGLVLLVAALCLSGCVGSRSSSSTSTKVEPAHVEKNEETGLAHLTLTEQASKRLGITTARVTSEGAKYQIPYAAVLYDDQGGTWVYTSPETLSFERHAITVDYIQGDVAVLSHGPAVGTKVVTVGVAELYGTESGVGH